jgi:hypothetical protein
MFGHRLLPLLNPSKHSSMPEPQWAPSNAASEMRPCLGVSAELKRDWCAVLAPDLI